MSQLKKQSKLCLIEIFMIVINVPAYLEYVKQVILIFISKALFDTCLSLDSTGFTGGK